MFELPEMVTLARQMHAALKGKRVNGGNLGNSPHKFVWHNLGEEAFAARVAGKTVGEPWVQGRCLFVPLEPGYVLVFGECGGKVLYHAAGAKPPKKVHLRVDFEDGSYLTATTQMWGAFELYERGEEQNREYVKDMRTTPVEPEFTFEVFSELIDDLLERKKKRSTKSLLTQDQLIPGLGNAIAQDILFRARLHPRHDIADLTHEQRETLFHAIVETVQEVIDPSAATTRSISTASEAAMCV